MQIKSNQLLLPVDIKASNDAQVQRDGVSLVDVQDALKDARFALLIIDACRDNPFPQDGTRGIGAGTCGLLPTDPITGQAIVLSAGRNQLALDNVPGTSQPNGLFTWELAQVIQTPGIEIRAALETVKDRVDEKARGVGHQQRPNIVSDLRGNFYFFGPTTVQVQSGATADPETETWRAADSVGTAAAYQSYLKRYPQGRYVDAANIKLNAPQKPVSSPPSVVLPSPPATLPAPIVPPAVAGTAITPSPVATSTADDPEAALWFEVKASGAREYLEVYLKLVFWRIAARTARRQLGRRPHHPSLGLPRQVHA